MSPRTFYVCAVPGCTETGPLEGPGGLPSDWIQVYFPRPGAVTRIEVCPRHAAEVIAALRGEPPPCVPVVRKDDGPGCLLN